MTLRKDWDFICVGAGITSQAFAAEAVSRRPGVRALVLEKHQVAGGYASQFIRPLQQAVFDCSLHKLSGMRPGGNLDASAKETTNNSDAAIFRITRVNNLTPALNIFYSLGGTASNGVDYAALSGVVVMPAGAATVDVVIDPVDDTEIEDPEGITFTNATAPPNWCGSGS